MCMLSFVCGLVTYLCPTLLTPMECSHPGSFLSGISQARILECVAPSPRDLSDPGFKPWYPTLQEDLLSETPGTKPIKKTFNHNNILAFH